MIDRYAQKEITQLFSEETKFDFYLLVEKTILKILQQKNIIPNSVLESCAKIKININRIHEIEEHVHHDVVAFCQSITEQMPPELGKYFHYGVTSSDVIDTALSLQIKAALNLYYPLLDQLKEALHFRILQDADILTLGRSHGRFAEPMIFAQKWLSFLSELHRFESDLKSFEKLHLVAMCSGAVGNYTILNPETEEMVAQALNLKVEPVSSQIVPRDRLARLMQNFAIFGAFLERISVELRLLQHNDVNEVQEAFREQQKGSSTMPHKKNPISAENLTGMSRMLRSYAQVSLENCVLWHERDISHSAPERIYLPEAFHVLFYSTKRLTKLLEKLIVEKKIIEQKVMDHPYVFSSYLLHLLIPHNNHTREFWYSKIQQWCFQYLELPPNANNSWWSFINDLLKEEGVDSVDFSWQGIKAFYQANFLHIKARIFH